MNRIENATRNKIQNAAKNGLFLLMENLLSRIIKVKPGDSTKVMFSHPPYENLLVGEEMPLDIVLKILIY